jgi:glycosyltransferase involved in cell wall biosynthesis
MKKINIVLPVYNECEGIADFHRELSSVLDLLNEAYRFEVIYVVDRSSDNTLDLLCAIAKTAANVRVISLSRRFGHQQSLIAGMDASDGDAVIMMDSDLEHPPTLIPQLLAEYEKGNDVVLTRRVYSEDTTWFKKFASHTFYRMLSLLSTVPISEDGADFRLISRKVLKVFQTSFREQHQFLRGLFSWVGFNTTTVAFVSRQREKGRSKYTLRRMIAFAVIGIISFSKVPLQISIYVGLVMSALAILHGIVMVALFFFAAKPPAGWTTLIALVSFLGGMQLIAMGIIGEYIGAIFDEVKHRPLYIIQDIFGYPKLDNESDKRS